MTNADYIALARADNVWHEIVASFAIEDLVPTEENEVIIGRMIAKDISFGEAIEIIRANASLKIK